MRGGSKLNHELEYHYDKIYKYCYFKTNNLHLAEDLTQETFTKFFAQHTYINKGKTLAYLYTIAKHLCIDSYKKVDTLLIRENDLIEYTINEFESNYDVKQAVLELPELMQELLLLRYANDLSMKSISEITGLSRYAVYRRIKQALSKLREKLRKDDYR